jgi:hypothetical protein
MLRPFPPTCLAEPSLSASNHCPPIHPPNVSTDTHLTHTLTRLGHKWCSEQPYLTKTSTTAVPSLRVGKNRIESKQECDPDKWCVQERVSVRCAVLYFRLSLYLSPSTSLPLPLSLSLSLCHVTRLRAHTPHLTHLTSPASAPFDDPPGTSTVLSGRADVRQSCFGGPSCSGFGSCAP